MSAEISQSTGRAPLLPVEIPRSERATERVPISSLLAGDSPRLAGENIEHIELLAAAEAPLPPILVHRESMRVVDGMHRMRAALLRGQETIEVEFFDGSQADAFIGAVRANIAHGLPLTLADREAAAARIVRTHPHCSDRWIAVVTGLAAGTVGAIRRRTGEGCEVTARVGRDGRVRPLRNDGGRRLALDAMHKNPRASLREIAKVAGISPATVRDVRERMRRGDDPVVTRRPRSQDKPGPVIRSAAERSQAGASRGPLRDPDQLLHNLKRDPSLRLTQSGRSLLLWLGQRAIGPGDWADFLEVVPPHCAYLVAELARGCAERWLELARQLERRLGEQA